VTCGGALIKKAFTLTARTSTLISMLVSAIAAALAHNFGPSAEPFVVEVAGYRVLEGLAFATLYVARGFAAAAYAHTFYEALLLFVYA
jgi:hypothetical protein